MRFIGFIGREKYWKLSAIFIVVSVVLFSVSILAVYGSVSSHNDVKFQQAGTTVY